MYRRGKSGRLKSISKREEWEVKKYIEEGGVGG